MRCGENRSLRAAGAADVEGGVLYSVWCPTGSSLSCSLTSQGNSVCNGVRHKHGALFGLGRQRRKVKPEARVRCGGSGGGGGRVAGVGVRRQQVLAAFQKNGCV